MTSRSFLLLILAVFIVSTCIYILTRSFWASAGVMILLMIMDGFLVQYDNRRRKRYERRKIQEQKEAEE